MAWIRDRVEVTKATVIAATVWAVAVAAALVLTLHSLSATDFDGLNNLAQLPLALPWSLFPISGLWQNHWVDAWVTAGMGWFNAGLMLFFGRALWRGFRA